MKSFGKKISEQQMASNKKKEKLEKIYRKAQKHLLAVGLFGEF